MKEMVGGCCVCSDERGWQENPLVYCDGQDCSVAVHQACYGIVSVPTGPWYCEKCVSGDGSSSRFRCDLCPMREGALKRTDKNGWAHVVCALYIPEVRFGNVTTMDPIILSQVPPERFNKVCYICEEKGSTEKAKVGACMQCNKNGCKACFHVTCAQQEGLLCEESGIQDNIKYCGYCSHHFKKLRKDPLIKAIPPYRPFVSASSSVSSATIGSTNKDRSSINNNRNLSTAGGNLSNVHNSNNNNNHHSTNPRENCIKPSANVSKLPTTSTPPVQNSISAVVTPPAVTVVSVATNPVKPTAAAATSGIHIPIQASALSAVSGTGPSLAPSLPQPVPSIPRPVVAVDGGSETASSPWTKPVPQISYLGFNNDILHSDISGHVVGGAMSVNTMVPPSTVAAAPITGPGIGTLAPIAAISSVLPPSGFALKSASTFAGNIESATSNPTRTTTVSAGAVSSAPVETATTAPVITTAAAQAGQATTKLNKVSSGSSADRKRKSESKDPGPVVAGNGEPPGDKPKKRRTSTKKTVKSLLELVSPVVEDTVSSFQREKVASQRSEMFQQQLQQQLHQQQQQHVQQQHQQSSIDSVIAATAAGHQSTSQAPTTAPPERPSIPAAAAAMVPEVLEQPPLAIPVANIIAPPPPPKSAPFRSPQDASSFAGASAFPTSLEQLLERQWEQGSQFLMEQAQHFDIASLLSCLHQLKMENQRLEDHVVSLAGRRDHLLAVNARLSLSLGQQHQSPNSPRISTVAPVATPFLHLQAPNSQDSSHDTSENSASSRLSAPPNTSTPIALHQPFVGATIVPVVATSKAMQTPTTATSSSIVVSPTNRNALSSLTAAVASPNFAVLPGGSGVGGGVFSSVKNKPSQEPSPDRQQQVQQQAPGSFLIPRAPTPMLATDLVRPQSSLVSNQYPVTQDPHHRMFYQLMQQNALAAAYGNAFTSLMQSTSPHRAAAAVLAQSHLTPHPTGAPPAPSSSQERS